MILRDLNVSIDDEPCEALSFKLDIERDLPLKRDDAFVALDLAMDFTTVVTLEMPEGFIAAVSPNYLSVVDISGRLEPPDVADRRPARLREWPRWLASIVAQEFRRAAWPENPVVFRITLPDTRVNVQP